MTSASPGEVQEVLWKPELWPEDDYARPPTRYQLCDICRTIMASRNAIERLKTYSGITLCRGSSQDTSCSLRAMILTKIGAEDGPPAKIRAWNKYHGQDIEYLEILCSGSEEQHYRIARLSLEAYAGMYSTGTFRVCGRLTCTDLHLDDSAAKYIRKRPLLSDFASQQAFYVMDEWMKQCEQSHPNCANATKNVALPTRVIDVESLKIHIPPPGETGRYVALTYCWGCPLVRGGPGWR